MRVRSLSQHFSLQATTTFFIFFFPSNYLSPGISYLNKNNFSSNLQVNKHKHKSSTASKQDQNLLYSMASPGLSVIWQKRSFHTQSGGRSWLHTHSFSMLCSTAQAIVLSCLSMQDRKIKASSFHTVLCWLQKSQDSYKSVQFYYFRYILPALDVCTTINFNQRRNFSPFLGYSCTHEDRKRKQTRLKIKDYYLKLHRNIY